ncbi:MULTISPECIES: IclR family transcriptional regulator [Streptomyces]|uniref:IclR family transcriptional regulator n=1 Tax=Streptomyces cacaoi TaxID=1898 RepID=A0A4Y3R8V4_STRCI|nr:MULTISPECIES: IclR family transcriptional regulator [Streptomyces]NNG87442.1 IclR family transcriptional regulator [Streptomyces cacaoi]QHF96264.1 IclR family transcriptional regulator [Streptomyces sp. NHF165]GEB54175.1 IclR family transcriptional regulator [Streptomyces cacaoi]
MTTDRGAPLQTADRVLQVLLAFSHDREEWGVTDLAAEFGWDKSVAQRLLASLAHRGFLVSDAVTRRYRLGPAVWHMATAWERHGGMAGLVRPTLRELAAESGVTALFAVPDGAHLRCVESADGSTGPLRAYRLADELYPGHAGATSRAYFGMLTPGARAAALYGRPMARFSELTVTDPDELEELMSRVPTEGHVYSEGEYDPATAGLAVPVVVRSQPIGSLTLVGPHDQLDGRQDELLVPLRAAAAGLGELLTPRRVPRAGQAGRTSRQKG